MKAPRLKGLQRHKLQLNRPNSKNQLQIGVRRQKILRGGEKAKFSQI